MPRDTHFIGNTYAAFAYLDLLQGELLQIDFAQLKSRGVSNLRLQSDFAQLRCSYRTSAPSNYSPIGQNRTGDIFGDAASSQLGVFELHEIEAYSQVLIHQQSTISLIDLFRRTHLQQVGFFDFIKMRKCEKEITFVIAVREGAST